MHLLKRKGTDEALHGLRKKHGDNPRTVFEHAAETLADDLAADFALLSRNGVPHTRYQTRHNEVLRFQKVFSEQLRALPKTAHQLDNIRKGMASLLRGFGESGPEAVKERKEVAAHLSVAARHWKDWMLGETPRLT